MSFSSSSKTASTSTGLQRLLGGSDLDDHDSNPLNNLETGFSLSENAHGEIQKEEEDEEENLVPTTTVNGDSVGNDADMIEDRATETSVDNSSLEDLRQQIVEDMIGGTTAVVTSPLEESVGISAIRPLIYCDFTASHRSLQSIEDYIQSQCLPNYGNTHTNTSLTGSQSTAFCSEARQIIGEVCTAKTTGKASQDIILFA